MPVYEETETRWNLFYVAYRSQPDPPDRWLTNHEGRISHQCPTPGRGGYGGPYEDIAVILEPGQRADTCGRDCRERIHFSPIVSEIAGWDSTEAQTRKRNTLASGAMGLCSATDLRGPWQRLSSLNPIRSSPNWVSRTLWSRRVSDGCYLAVFDVIRQTDCFGYATSRDGIHW